MPGEMDLPTMLASLTVSRRPGIFVVVYLERPVPLGDGVEAVLTEDEGTTVVATAEAARRNGWSGEFPAAWLTLDVHSALESVGRTAAVSSALAEIAMPCNILAGFHHDHLLVPVDRVDEATGRLLGLGLGAGGAGCGSRPPPLPRRAQE